MRRTISYKTGMQILFCMNLNANDLYLLNDEIKLFVKTTNIHEL